MNNQYGRRFRLSIMGNVNGPKNPCRMYLTKNNSYSPIESEAGELSYQELGEFFNNRKMTKEEWQIEIIT
jgi:hypothetical protein